MEAQHFANLVDDVENETFKLVISLQDLVWFFHHKVGIALPNQRVKRPNLKAAARSEAHQNSGHDKRFVEETFLN